VGENLMLVMKWLRRRHYDGETTWFERKHDAGDMMGAGDVMMGEATWSDRHDKGDMVWETWRRKWYYVGGCMIGDMIWERRQERVTTWWGDMVTDSTW
jgi:hypothetical protein